MFLKAFTTELMSRVRLLVKKEEKANVRMFFRKRKTEQNELCSDAVRVMGHSRFAS